MFLVDDILLSPVYGVAWIARQVLEASRQERAAEEESITAALSELYMMLDTGTISEEEFGTREQELLDRYDGVQERRRRGEGEEESQ